MKAQITYLPENEDKTNWSETSRADDWTEQNEYRRKFQFLHKRKQKKINILEQKYILPVLEFKKAQRVNFQIWRKNLNIDMVSSQFSCRRDTGK